MGELLKVTETSRSLAGKPPLPIPMRDLDLRPGPCCMSFGFPLEALVESIRSVGLIHPPLLTKDRRGRWIIVSGYRRIHAAKRLQWEEVPCRDISQSGFSLLECLQINLHENLGTRSLNHVEKGMVLARLTGHVSRDELLMRYMPLLGLPSHVGTLETLIRVTQEFPEELLKAVAAGNLPAASCRVLLDMRPEDRLAVSEMFSAIPFNRNQQRQFIELIADRGGDSDGFASRTLGQAPIRNICKDPRMNGPQRASALIRALRHERFPLLTAAQHRLERVVAALQLPKGVRIRHDPGFESSTYVLEVEFVRGEELLQTLRRMVEKKGWEELGDPWEAEE